VAVTVNDHGVLLVWVKCVRGGLHGHACWFRPAPCLGAACIGSLRGGHEIEQVTRDGRLRRTGADAGRKVVVIWISGGKGPTTAMPWTWINSLSC